MVEGKEKNIKTVIGIAKRQCDFKIEKENSLGRASFAYRDIVSADIELPKEFAKAVKIQADHCLAHRSGMNHHASEYRERNEKMWEIIKTACYGLDFEKFEYSFNLETKILSCVGESGK